MDFSDSGDGALYGLDRSQFVGHGYKGVTAMNGLSRQDFINMITNTKFLNVIYLSGFRANRYMYALDPDNFTLVDGAYMEQDRATTGCILFY